MAGSRQGACVRAVMRRVLWLVAALLAVPGGAGASDSAPGSEVRRSAPQLGVGSRSEIIQGRPLVLSVVLAHPGSLEPGHEGRVLEERVVESASGGWDRLLTLEVHHRKDGKRTLVQWPLRRVETPPGRVALTSTTPRVVIHYVLSPEETVGLTPGQYFITARLDTTQGASEASWKGTADAVGVVWLKERPAEVSPDEVCQAALESYGYLDLVGRSEEALRVLDASLKEAPDGRAWACFEKRAAIAEAAGQLSVARDYYCQSSKEMFLRIVTDEAERKAKGIPPPCFVAVLPEEDGCQRLTRVLEQRPPGPPFFKRGAAPAKPGGPGGLTAPRPHDEAKSP